VIFPLTVTILDPRKQLGLPTQRAINFHTNTTRGQA
jgi:hypothetical protein